MANDATRLSTADLRRRLLGNGTAADPAPVPTRPTLPSAYLDTPVEEDGATVPIAELMVEDPAPPVPVEPTPVSAARLTPPELRRPETRTTPQLPRPMVPPPPPPVERAPERPAERSTGRSSHFHARPVLPGSTARSDPRDGPASELLKPEPDSTANRLKEENAQLQQLLDEMRQLLQEASEQEQRVQAELTDRDQKLTETQGRIAELETIINTKPKTKTELEEWADELERESFQIAQERRTFDEDRKQLREDESSLEKQMRDMEVQMARERALLARQEQELKRLNAEIQHELELMQRGDGVLRERLAVFQRRHAEVVGSDGPPVATSYFGSMQSPVAAPAPMAGAPGKKGDSTGFMRKLFRGE